MRSPIEFFVFAVALVATPLLIGCGDPPDSVIVGGNDPRYHPPAGVQEAYQKSMEQSRAAANPR